MKQFFIDKLNQLEHKSPNILESIRLDAKRETDKGNMAVIEYDAVIEKIRTTARQDLKDKVLMLDYGEPTLDDVEAVNKAITGYYNYNLLRVADYSVIKHDFNYIRKHLKL